MSHPHKKHFVISAWPPSLERGNLLLKNQISGYQSLSRFDGIGLYPKDATASHFLSWSHVIELLKIDDPLERRFYEKQMVLENWSVRERKRQKDSGLFFAVSRITRIQTISDGVERWYREQIRSEVSKVIERWEKRLGVKVERFFVQRMETRWGSCNPTAASIRLNTDLAKKPIQCLEYIVVHEMMHLLEPTHNARFIALMDRFMPQWQERRQLLNRLPK